MRRTAFLSVAMLTVSLGCAGTQGGMSQVDEAADIAAVEAVVAMEMATLLTGDVAGNVALFTEDAVIMPPGMPAVMGPEAEAFFTAFLEEFAISEGEYVRHDIEIHGDVAIDYYQGELMMTPVGSDEPVLVSMKGIHVLKRQADGSWKISHDVWNPNDGEEP